MPDPTPGPTASMPHPPREFNPFAATLAWLWPGLGHISLGEKRRGLLIMTGVLFLFLSGLLVGGMTSVDRREERLWFLAQGLCGPIAFVADYVNQNHVKRLPPERLERAVAIGNVSEMGTLFVALAGLMNLVVILDALHFAPRPAPERRRREEDHLVRDLAADQPQDSHAASDVHGEPAERSDEARGDGP